MRYKKITLTKTELKKILVIEKLVARHIKIAESHALLQLSTRQVLRLKKTSITEGAEGFPIKTEAANLHTPSLMMLRRWLLSYTGRSMTAATTATFFELLEEHESLSLSVSSIRRILLSQEIKRSDNEDALKRISPVTVNRKPECFGRSMLALTPG